MRRRWTARASTLIFLSAFVAAPVLPGCEGGNTVETPKEIPPAPQASSKASFQALQGQTPKGAPKPAPDK